MFFMKYIGRRILIFIPQLIGIIIVAFLLVRLLPGNPATAIAGSLATEDTVRGIEERMGLDKPIYVQFGLYMRNILKGDLGRSWYTSNPVVKDLLIRFPATLELITYSMIIAILLGVILGILAALKPGGVVDKFSASFSLIAGALPEFWLGLLLIFFLYSKLGVVVAPIGRLSIGVSSPSKITGFVTVDALLTGNFATFSDASAHLLLPVMTLSIVLLGPILKMTRASMIDVLQSEYIYHARICGISNKFISNYALRSSLPPIVTLIGVLYGFMLGGAVLVETVFGWGGLGLYGVQSVINKDYNAVQGFLLISAFFSLVIYLLVDIFYLLIDPRIRR